MRGVEFNILIQMWQISAMNKYKHSNTGGRPVNSTGQLVHIGEHNGTFTHSMEQLGWVTYLFWSYSTARLRLLKPQHNTTERPSSLSLSIYIKYDIYRTPVNCRWCCIIKNMTTTMTITKERIEEERKRRRRRRRILKDQANSNNIHTCNGKFQLNVRIPTECLWMCHCVCVCMCVFTIVCLFAIWTGMESIHLVSVFLPPFTKLFNVE